MFSKMSDEKIRMIICADVSLVFEKWYNAFWFSKRAKKL